MEAAFGKFFATVHKYADDEAVKTRNRELLTVLERAYHKWIGEQADELNAQEAEKREPVEIPALKAA